MKASITTLFVLVSFLAFSEAALSSEKLTVHPDYPDKCYSNVYKQAYEIGKEYDVPGKCEQIICLSQYHLSAQTCSSIGGAPPGCILTKLDYSKTYPDCCPHLICEEDQ